jgi:hypothetical protein
MGGGVCAGGRWAYTGGMNTRTSFLESSLPRLVQFYTRLHQREPEPLQGLMCPHCRFRLPNLYVSGEGVLVVTACPCCLGLVGFSVCKGTVEAKIVPTVPKSELHRG